MNMPPEKYAAFLRIRASFIGRLERECLELQRLSERLDPPPAPPAVMQDMSRIAHGLAGAAATFGFAPVGTAAAALHACLAGRAPAGQNDVRSAARHLLDALDQALVQGHGGGIPPPAPFTPPQDG